jgi:hypothetical protein
MLPFSPSSIPAFANAFTTAAVGHSEDFCRAPLRREDGFADQLNPLVEPSLRILSIIENIDMLTAPGAGASTS